jgi:DNA modification methylase
MIKQSTIDFEGSKQPKPVTCLGQIFDSEDTRREHYRNLLREYLLDPEFRKIEGFPIGEDEDIVALSDPPYYTACPNPWINDFIAEWEKEKGARPDEYHREPFATDVSEGKNDPIYNAHSYHTKVPHKAIMRYILHYTEPGDIVFDGFCGSGMTGVAAQLCGDKKVVESLGYQVKDDGTILDEEGKPFSKLGTRKAILNDLSPAATFIAANFNSPVDLEVFEREAKHILEKVDEECGWMYETLHIDGKTKGKINFTVWSDVFVCPNCMKEFKFWDAAVDRDRGMVLDEFPCPYCEALLTKRSMDRAYLYSNDNSNLKDHIVIESTSCCNHYALNEQRDCISKIAKQVPVLINYSVGSKSYEKSPDELDIQIIERISSINPSYWYPANELPVGYNTNQPIRSHGFSSIYHFYTNRNLITLSLLNSLAVSHQVKFMLTGLLNRATKLNQLHLKNYFFGGGGCNAGHRKGTLYAPSVSIETSILQLLRERVKSQWRAYQQYLSSGNCIISCQSLTDKFPEMMSSSVDYTFVDPPFGANIMYSELSFLWEGWLRVFTNNHKEAIENPIQRKGHEEYRELIERCLSMTHNYLKLGRWITIEFSNTSAFVWNSFQIAIEKSGFVIADVSSLDKKQGGMATIRSRKAVIKDLIISAYKPDDSFEKTHFLGNDTDNNVWDFIRKHLSMLPIVKHSLGKSLVPNKERDPRILFDRLVSHYVQNGYWVPLDSHEFQEGLEQRFSCRDGLYFLPEQVFIYDKYTMESNLEKQSQIFIEDEVSAIEWLRSLLKDKPQTYQEINTPFQRAMSTWNKQETLLELSTILDQNFLKYDDKTEVPSQIHTYLSTNWKELRNLSKDDPALKTKAKDRWYVPDPNKLADLEKMREKALLKEFWNYLPKDYKSKKLNDLQIEIPDLPKSTTDLLSGKRYKVIRAEAVRAGFKYCWQNRDYETIILVAKRIPSSLLEEDPKLLMYYDQAVTRSQ